jgi:urease accessory protein
MLITQSARVIVCTALCVLPALAFAHPGNESGLMAGVVHPLTGIDHLLAMFAVGLWAAQQKGGARWMLPVAFVGCMLLGGLLGFDGLSVPYLESGIAASVLALGLLVAVAASPPIAVSIVITGLAGLAHGIAHGMELPQMASPAWYAVGFVSATSALHATGYGLARWRPIGGAMLIRTVGLVSAGAGALLLAG